MNAFTRSHRLVGIGASGALAVSAFGFLPTAATGSTGATGASDATASGTCRVVQLAEPDRGYDGAVVDIEVVDGQTLYYGNTLVRDKHAVEHQRALVWEGLGGDPVRVGPSGYDEDIAFELTASGLVNGQSVDWHTGVEAAWVQDLRSGEVTILDTESGPRGSGHGGMWMRRINDAGRVVGIVFRNWTDPWADAVTFVGPDAPMELLPGVAAAADSLAFGINNQAQKTGYLATREYEEAPGWYAFDPVVWQSDGTITPMSVAGGFEAVPRAIKDDGSASGSMLAGQSVDSAHVEPAYWPDPSRVVPLGVLPGGGWGDVFGMDEGGWLVGALDRGVKRNDRLAEGGLMRHAFLWTPSIGEGRVRLLPSLYATAKGEQDWRDWQGSAVHAVNGDLDQAGAGSHVEFRHGRAIQAPTVWMNVDRCGAEVATTHDPFGLQESTQESTQESAQESAQPTSSRASARTTARVSRLSARVVKAWKRSSVR